MFDLNDDLLVEALPCACVKASDKNPPPRCRCRCTRVGGGLGPAVADPRSNRALLDAADGLIPV